MDVQLWRCHDLDALALPLAHAASAEQVSIISSRRDVSHNLQVQVPLIWSATNSFIGQTHCLQSWDGPSNKVHDKGCIEAPISIPVNAPSSPRPGLSTQGMHVKNTFLSGCSRLSLLQLPTCRQNFASSISSCTDRQMPPSKGFDGC